MICSGKALAWSPVSDSKAHGLTFHISLGESTRRAWQVSPLLEKPHVNSCPQWPLFQGNGLVFLPGIAHNDTGLQRALLQALWVPPGLSCHGVCFQLLCTPGFLLGLQLMLMSDIFRRVGVPWTGGGGWSRDHHCALGPLPTSFVAWDKLLCLLGLTFTVYKMELLKLTYLLHELVLKIM